MELFDHIFFDNEKLWIVLFLKDKWTLDTNTRHAARIYSLWEYIYIRVCVCPGYVKTVCGYLRSKDEAAYIKRFSLNFLAFLDKSATIITSKVEPLVSL